MIRDWLTRCWWARILAEHDTEPIELQGATLKILLGFWLLLPWDSFDASPTFRYLDAIPETAWGTFLLITGFIHWYTLRSGYREMRRVSCLLGFLVWFALTVVFLVANAPAIGFAAFFVVALGQGWSYIRLGITE